MLSLLLAHSSTSIRRVLGVKRKKGPLPVQIGKENILKNLYYLSSCIPSQVQQKFSTDRQIEKIFGISVKHNQPVLSVGHRAGTQDVLLHPEYTAFPSSSWLIALKENCLGKSEY